MKLGTLAEQLLMTMGSFKTRDIILKLIFLLNNAPFLQSIYKYWSLPLRTSCGAL
jgi:hypothetical protein